MTLGRAQRDEALASLGAVPLNPEAANASRFVSRDGLRYSLRSLAQYAPWVRHIWLVTAGQVPGWLDVRVPGLTVVDHRDIFGGRGEAADLQLPRDRVAAPPHRRPRRALPLCQR
ncbi:hypothetical protein [Actinomadura madurae]|uniref:hypothetical protein n=1 Tax=Actinomadura madurae TaxID=1993 RepID=UPI0009429C4B